MCGIDATRYSKAKNRDLVELLVRREPLVFHGEFEDRRNAFAFLDGALISGRTTRSSFAIWHEDMKGAELSSTILEQVTSFETV
jgi:hypothetical protein